MRPAVMVVVVVVVVVVVMVVVVMVLMLLLLVVVMVVMLVLMMLLVVVIKRVEVGPMKVMRELLVQSLNAPHVEGTLGDWPGRPRYGRWWCGSCQGGVRRQNPFRGHGGGQRR